MSAATWKQSLYKILELVFKNRGEFTLPEVYLTCEGYMSYLYPDNKTIKASIRHHLQVLRDDGLVLFIDDNGTYCLLN